MHLSPNLHNLVLLSPYILQKRKRGKERLCYFPEVTQLVGEEAMIWIHVDELKRATNPHTVPFRRSSLKAESSINTYYAQRDRRNHN